MYLSKNSRSVLRNGPWFTFGRNFKVSFVKSRARWPEDDPLKPPLRLNIPKEISFDSHMGFSDAKRTDKLSQKFVLNPEMKCQHIDGNNSGCGSGDETSEGNGNSYRDNQNYLVKSKSNESLNSGKKEYYESKTEKNSKLKKIRSFEGVQLKSETDNPSDELQVKDKNGILTIQIALNDQSEHKIISKLSQTDAAEDVSDDQISALAEAIVNELRCKDGAESRLSTSQNDDAYLVIVNVTDKDSPEDSPSAVNDVPLDRRSDNLISKSSGFGDADAENRSELKQVRNLDEMKKNLLEKNVETSANSKRYWKTKTRPEPVFRYVVNRVGGKDEIQLLPSGLNFFKRNSFENRSDIFRDKERRKREFEKRLRKARIFAELVTDKLEPRERRGSGKRFEFARPVGYASENYLENKIEALGDEPEKTAVTAFVLKPLSKEITFLDELPEVLKYPALRKSKDEEISKLNSGTIRSYHISRKNYCKLTKGFADDKRNLESGEKTDDNDFDKTGDISMSKGGGDGSIVNVGVLRRGYPMTKLDNTLKCSELSDNDIYLQERDVIDNVVKSRTEGMKIENGYGVERYESDITDVNWSAFKGSYGTTYPANEGEIKLMKEFGNLAAEDFEMNVKCLGEQGTDAGSRSEASSIGESLLDSKKDALISVVKEEGSTPKISDNIANLANEGIAERKDVAAVDSLSMMKRVKEMVDLDLTNAEKIFVRTEPKGQKGPSPATLNSVVIHNESINNFYVDANELDIAVRARKKEDPPCAKSNERAEVKVGKYNGREGAGVNLSEYVSKSGESIIVCDEKTNKWKVDFTFLKEHQKKQEKEKREDDAPMEKNKRNVEEDPSGCSIRPKEKKKETEMGKLRKSPRKDGGREVDAQEIRKKNSDLYDDLFDVNKQSGKVKKEEKETQKKTEKNPSEHYVSENIVEMSKSNTADKAAKLKSNKIETVKPNMAESKRPPSEVKEINLNEKCKGKGSMRKDPGKIQKKPGSFYKDLEKYKTPFGDPEYEEKHLKINSDSVSNPNLKKLDSCNKTLVLQEISKSPDNIETWVKDETDKMATLLLKVLQEAAESNNRRKVTGKTQGRGNPYEAIRKKQERGLVKKKEPGKKSIPVNVANGGNKVLRELTHKNEKFAGEEEPVATTTDILLPKRVPYLRKMGSSESECGTEDIPGPEFLKRLSSVLKWLPEIGCQMTIFIMMAMFSMVKMGLSLLSSDVSKARNHPFGGLFTKYGPVVKIQGPLSGNVVLINRPEDVRTVFAQTETSAASVLDSLENCRNRVKEKNFPIGVADSCNGIDWDVVRKSTVDVGNKGCSHYISALGNTNAMLVNRIATIRNNQKQVPDDFIHELKKWSMEGLCSVLFDKSIGFMEKRDPQIHWVCESERLLRSFQEATNALCRCESKFQIWRLFNSPAMSDLGQAYQTLDLIISKYVYQAEVSLRKKRKDITNHKSSRNNNLNFLESVLLNDRTTPDEIIANIIDVMLIGVNTTTAALGFLLYNLAQNSSVQGKLFKEVKDLVPNINGEIGYHQLHSLKYLQACLKESMRLNAPIPFVLKVLPGDISLKHYRLPQGTHLVMDTQTACMKEQNFEEPERFKPERWLDQDCVHPFSSIPFCHGPRAGFVRNLAEVHLWTCIAKIVRNYRIEYHFGDVKSTRNVLSYPDKPLKLTFIERDD